MLVTYNIKDFPHNILSKHNIRAIHPDEFLLDQFELNNKLVIQSLQSMSDSTNKPKLTLDEILGSLEEINCKKFSKRVRQLLAM